MSESRRPGHGGEFFTLLQALRVFRAGPLTGDPSDRALARAAGISPTTIGDWLQGRRFPQDIGKVLVMVRMVRAAAVRHGVAIPGSGPAGLLDEDRWRAAYQQEAQRRASVVSGGVEQARAAWALAGPRVRVREADPRLLGVHAAITVPGVPDDVPPEYVPRDVDAAEHRVRARMATAAARGGFVLLVGGSSVGKTRCAAEAVKALLQDWWLVHPSGPGEIAALAATPPARVVVWLDELQRYLDGEQGLTGGVVRVLLNAPDPIVIIGTLWPERYAAYTVLPAPGSADPHAREREVLDLAAVIRIGPVFSTAEEDRARAAAGRDRRLAVALEAHGYGLTQTLAAAPQLVARWEGAQTAEPYAWAVLTAALDAARLGASAPLSADFLRAAAPGYCTSQQQADAPANWFERALAYATEKLNGAASALAPAAVGMGQIAGYTVADYLIQHATRERRTTHVPASTWDAIVSHVRDPADAARLADSANRRLLYRYALPLYRHAAGAGAGVAALRLTGLLIQRGDLDEATQILRAMTDAGNAISSLANQLADQLAAYSDRADKNGITTLADILSAPATAEELRDRDRAVAVEIAYQLAGHGDLGELRARADGGDRFAAWQLAGLLVQRGDLDEATQILHARTDAGDRTATLLADLLLQRGDLDGAMQVLRAGASAGDRDAALQLADLLAERGDLDELRTSAGAGDRAAALRLADLLAEGGDLDGAMQIQRTLADGGLGDVKRLTELLAQQGRGEEAERIRRFGLNPDGSIACG